MKMKEKDGFWYALEAFNTYKYRAKFLVYDVDGKQLINTDVYTTNTDMKEVEKILLTSANKKYKDRINMLTSGISYWTTKHQDDLASELIDEWLLKED